MPNHREFHEIFKVVVPPAGYKVYTLFHLFSDKLQQVFWNGAIIYKPYRISFFTLLKTFFNLLEHAFRKVGIYVQLCIPCYFNGVRIGFINIKNGKYFFQAKTYYVIQQNNVLFSLFFNLGNTIKRGNTPVGTLNTAYLTLFCPAL